MRMQNCPHCGANNSIKRTTCYHCQQPLLAPEQEPSAPAASSRWEALEPLHGQATRRVLRPAPDDAFAAAASRGEAPTAARAAARRYLPSARRSLAHIRRMSQFFRQLSTMTGSSLTLAAACRELQRTGPKKLRSLAAQMLEAAEKGAPISSAMERDQHLFYPWHLGLLRAAEAGGFLPEAFDRIAHAYEVEWETRSALRLRLFFYVFFGLPAMLLVLPVVRFLQQPIPEIDSWTPQYVIDGLLAQVRSVSLPIAIGFIAVVLVWQLLGATAWFQGVQQRIVARLPLVGSLARTHALDRYLSTLGLMLRGSVPLGEAAEQAALSAGHAVLTPKLLRIVPALRGGVPLSQALGAERLLDADALGMTATGEASGALPDMLTRAADYYRLENEAKRRMLLRAAGIAIGVLWLSLAGALLISGYLTYFDFLFRAGDKLWMEQ
ncbi:MAG: type II secretion system F family protein [Armatimonadota bacterium]|nr:MAG: type II secretion system F family protein [Armatimonadota bacterium]